MPKVLGRKYKYLIYILGTLETGKAPHRIGAHLDPDLTQLSLLAMPCGIIGGESRHEWVWKNTRNLGQPARFRQVY